MRTLIRTAVVTMLAAVLVACASSRVATDFDQAIDFNQYRSFAWIDPAVEPVEDPLLDSELLGRKLQRSTVDALTERGFLQAEDADFLVTYHTASRERLRDAGGFRFGFGFGRGLHHGHHSIFLGDSFYPSIESYQEGTLILDVIDARTRQLVWRGWTRGTVHPSRYTDEAIDGAVRAILSKFPPGYKESA